MRKEYLAYNEADDTRVPAAPMCHQSSAVSWWAACARPAVTLVLVKRCNHASSLRPKQGRGPSLAARTPPRVVSTRRASASLAALAAADALAGAGRALRTSTGRTRTGRASGTSIGRTGARRVLAAATAASTAVGAAALAGVQRAIAVLGAATRPARTRRVGGRSRRATRGAPTTATPAATTRTTTRAAGTRT